MIRKMGGIQRNTSILVLIDNNTIAVNDSDKAEILVETFVKVHSNANVSEDMRRYREQCVMDNDRIFVKKNPDGGTLDSDFTLYGMKRALVGIKQTSPGKDGICYEVIKYDIRTL